MSDDTQTAGAGEAPDLAEPRYWGRGEWVPEFEGQREAFREGNTIALRHGTHSPRVYGARASQLVAEKLASRPDLAPYPEALSVWATFLARFELEASRPEPDPYWLTRFGNAALKAGAALGLDPRSEATLTRDRAAAAALTASAAVDLGELAERGRAALAGRFATALSDEPHDDHEEDNG